MDEYQAVEGPRFTEVTRNIRVSVVPSFLDAESDLARGLYAFAYTVTLENLGNEKVQLINRHWVVVSGSKQIADVKGEGVVGEQPVLDPGDAYQYTSGSVIQDSVGSMYGTYTFRSENGEFFDVRIPKFDLVHIGGEVVH